VSALEATNYRLTFNGGSYTLQRVDNGAVVPMTGAGTVPSPFVANGLSIVVSGAPAASDQFFLKPLEHVAGTVQLLVTRPSDIARQRRRARQRRSRTWAQARSLPASHRCDEPAL
jgi:flagellar hook-associated protein 1 FlgK